MLETRKSSEWRRNFPAQLKQADFAGPLRGAELHEVLQGGETPCNVIRAGEWSLLLPFCESTLPRVAYLVRAVRKAASGVSSQMVFIP